MKQRNKQSDYIPDNFADAESDLLPVVLSRAFCETEAGRPGERPFNRNKAYEPLGDHHGVGLVYDMPDSDLMGHLTQRTLDKWAVSFAKVYDVAMRNLRAITPGPRFIQQNNGLYVSNFADGYDVSRMLLPELILELDVQGDPVAMPANRAMLLVTGAEDTEGLTAMADLTVLAGEKPRFNFGVPMQLCQGQWQEYQSPHDHPAALAFQNFQVESFVSDYEWQKAMMDRNRGEGDEDDDIAGSCYVASCSVLAVPGLPKTFSMCYLWSEVAGTLLPHTDIIGLGELIARRERGVLPLLVRWEHLCEIAGDLLNPLGMYPERYLVSRFPNARELEALRGTSLDLNPCRRQGRRGNSGECGREM